MMQGRGGTGLVVACTLGLVGGVVAADADPASIERGREALLTRSFVGPAWSLDAYARAGRFWGDPAPDPAADPEGYAAAFRRRYGLHPAPYPNDGLPMGLRRAAGRDGDLGLALDCLICHGGSIAGTSYVGLGNSQLDLKTLLDELNLADGKIPPISPATVNTTRGTNHAGQIAVILLSLRNEDLSFRRLPLWSGAKLPEMDTPAWWNLAPKRTKYYDGRTDARAVRSNMQFLLGEATLDHLKELEPTFRDIDAYLKSLAPPPYPFAIDAAKAERGRAVFEDRCAKCHGTYGPSGAYPSRIVPIDRIGTDRARLDGLNDRFIAHYNATWLGADFPVEDPPTGYQAPPLRGIWATAPYLHNGSVPTLYHMLKSAERPGRFRRPPSTDIEHFDPERVGWRFEIAAPPADDGKRESKEIVDTTRWGLGHQGHTFGDSLTDEQRSDVIEYLKSL